MAKAKRKFPRREPTMAQGYTTTDGQTFNNNRDAEMAQRRLDFALWYNGPNGDTLDSVHPNGLFEWLVANEDEARQVLGDS